MTFDFFYAPWFHGIFKTESKRTQKGLEMLTYECKDKNNLRPRFSSDTDPEDRVKTRSTCSR